MTEEAKEGYNYGVKTCLSILDQVLSQDIDDIGIPVFIPTIEEQTDITLKELYDLYEKYNLNICHKNGEE